MLMFTLAISYLTTSNLPWLMELTFQVPMQYCSLQHWALLLLPVTSRTGCCFCFCFLELFLHWSPGAYWAPTDLGVHLSVSYHYAFMYCSWGSQGKNTEVVCHSLLQWTTLCCRLECKVGSQETPGVTGTFGLGVQNEAGQRLIEFCQENALVIANTLLQEHKRRRYTWTSPDGQHQNQIDYILCSQRWRSEEHTSELQSR